MMAVEDIIQLMQERSHVLKILLEDFTRYNDLVCVNPPRMPAPVCPLLRSSLLSTGRHVFPS
jgi:hypothetical protein